MFGISTSSSLAALLLHTVSAPHAMAMALVPTPVNAHQLLPRESGEHVVLADCKDGTGLLSSQMAYFPGSPGKTPQDVATVQTSPGQAALWINRNTSGLFTTTGVTFRSTIGPKVADGEYAGTGTNGFGPFTCWQEFVKALYVYDGTTCSQVYDCSHERAPAVLPKPINSTDTPPPSPSQGQLSQGEIVGIAVGTAGGILFAGAMGLLFWYWKRARRNQQNPVFSKRSGSCCGLFGSREFVQPLPHSPMQSHKDGSQLVLFSEVNAKTKAVAYEMDGKWRGAEISNSHGWAEADGQARAEMDGHGRFEMDSRTRA